jgi:hypothetical protein
MVLTVKKPKQQEEGGIANELERCTKRI